MCVWLVLYIPHNFIDNRLKLISNISCMKISLFFFKKKEKSFLCFFFGFDRLFYLQSPSNIWILASGAAHSTEQAWPWLGELGDLWRRLKALCCVWDSVAFAVPLRSLYSLLPCFPAFNPASGSSRHTVRPLLPPLSLLLSPARDNKTHEVMWLL